MARKDRFPTERLPEIAEDVVDIFRDEEQVPTDEIVELGDGIPMWGLGLTGLWMPLDRLSEPAAFFLRRWIHPIRCYGRVVAHAESTFTETGDELYVPTISIGERFPIVLDEVKQGAPEGVSVRAIIEPSMGDLEAVWLHSDKADASEVCVVETPTAGGSETRMRIGESDFVRWVRQKALESKRAYRTQNSTSN